MANDLVYNCRNNLLIMEPQAGSKNYISGYPRHKGWIFMLLISLLAFTGCHSSHKSANKNADRVETVKVSKKLKGEEKRIVEEALSWQGTPYKYAGFHKGKGTDCSGMVLSVYESAAGIKLPRNSRKQAEFCKRIGKGSVRPGDLVFFATGKDASTISHVGIMIDEIRFVHASTKKGVIVSELTSPYYKRTFKMFGRVP
jgi:hypothetical protein